MTDRVPGRRAGNEFRVANVVEGLLDAGELHVVLVDSSTHGAPFEPDVRFDRSVVRGQELPRWLRIIEGVWRIPHMRYRHGAVLRRGIREAIGERRFDVVWFSRARMHWLCADMFDGAHILDLDDLNDRLLTSLAADRRRQLGGLRALPRGVLNRLVAGRWGHRYRELGAEVDRLVVCHHGDRGHLDASKVAVVPNGYPVPELEATAAPPASGCSRMLFVGPLTYEPNDLAVRWFVDHVLDRVREAVPDATLSVVGAPGRSSASLQHEAVELHGWVHDVAPYYEGSAIAVAPLHSGGGTRIKILEAMALRRPLVATTFAIEGIDVVPGEDLLVADDEATFADACVRLLTDGELAAARVRSAHRTFLEQHSAQHARAAVVDVVSSVVSERAARSGGRP